MGVGRPRQQKQQEQQQEPRSSSKNPGAEHRVHTRFQVAKRPQILPSQTPRVHENSGLIYNLYVALLLFFPRSSKVRKADAYKASKYKRTRASNKNLSITRRQSGPKEKQEGVDLRDWKRSYEDYG